MTDEMKENAWKTEMLQLIDAATEIIEAQLLPKEQIKKLIKECRAAHLALKHYRYNSALQSARSLIRLRVALGIDNEMLLWAAYDID